MSTAEKYLDQKTFMPEESHYQGNRLMYFEDAMEYARLKSQEENKELVEALKKIVMIQQLPHPDGAMGKCAYMKITADEALLKHTPKG